MTMIMLMRAALSLLSIFMMFNIAMVILSSSVTIFDQTVNASVWANPALRHKFVHVRRQILCILPRS